MKCKICKTENPSCFSSKILGKYDVNYYHCSTCGFLQTEAPYWLDEAYSRPINLSDTGYMVRNLFFKDKLIIFLYLVFGQSGRFVDYAGGYGVFVRLMRDVGFDFLWYDKYTQNLFASGFEWDGKEKVDAITLFEVFEHFSNPVEELSNLLNITDTIIFSTELYPESTPQPKDWWYFGLDHGQHISFYSRESLQYLAEKFDANFFTLGSLHLITRKKINSTPFLATKLSRFGLHKIFERKLTSKVWLDYQKCCKVSSNENCI